MIFKSFRQSSESCFFSSVSFLESRDFPKNWKFSTFPGIWEISIRWGNENLHSICPQDHFWGRRWPVKALVYIVFGHWANFFLPDSSMFFGEIVRTSFYLCRGSFLENIFSKKRCLWVFLVFEPRRDGLFA